MLTSSFDLMINITSLLHNISMNTTLSLMNLVKQLTSEINDISKTWHYKHISLIESLIFDLKLYMSRFQVYNI